MFWKPGFLKRYWSSNKTLWLLIAASFSIGLLFSLRPLPELLDQCADDAFYYLTIARNIVSGKGISFDGISATNGFHPLYLTLLSALFKVFSPSPEYYLHGDLILCLLCFVLSAWPLYKLAAMIFDHQTSMMITCLWLFNPWALAIILNGVETGVYILCVAVTSYLYLQDRENRLRFRTGILMGLVILARTDGVFLLGGMAIDQLVILSKGRNVHWISLKTRFKDSFPFLAAILMITLPWFMWNWLEFGSILQVSGKAIFLQKQTEWLNNRLPWSRLAASYAILMMVRVILYTFQTFSFLLVTAGLRLVPRYRRKNTAQSQRSPYLGAANFLIYYAVGIFLFYTFYLRHHQVWYFMPIIFVTSIWFGTVYNGFRNWFPAPKPGQISFPALLAITVIILGLGAGLRSWQVDNVGKYAPQLNGYQLARWFSENTPAASRIGAWNSGILGYLTNRTVINLDGVVNNQLVHDAGERNASLQDIDFILDYADTMEIDYLSDYEDNSMVREYLASQGWVPVYEFASLKEENYQVIVFGRR